MLRRRTMYQIRKYSVVFFVVLFIFIICNHKQSRDAPNLQHIAQVPPKTSPAATSNRAQRLYELAEMQRIGPYMRRMVLEDLDPLKDLVPAQILPPKRKTEVDDKPEAYFVYSKQCKMPQPNLFSSDLVKPVKMETCTNETDFITLDYDVEQQQYKLHVNVKVMRKLMSDMNDLRCFYRDVTSSGLQAPVYFYQDEPLPRNLSAIVVECQNARSKHVLQQDAFTLVQVQNRKHQYRQWLNEVQRQPSVIMLGLDAMSRLNFDRAMPQTRKFVRQPGWYEMEGYNKVADTTFYNMLPVLTGCQFGQARKLCRPMNELGCLDRLPWIWQDYKRAGYVTAFGEDVSSGMFNGWLPGFQQLPVAHYLRPFMMGIGGALRIYNRCGLEYCIGRRLTVGYLYGFCQQFVQRYVEELDRPVFGVFWSYALTHQLYSGMDTKLVEYLNVLQGHQLFEHAIVILFSNHGPRQGDLLEPPLSSLAQRLPILHIYLPAWFRHAYPHYVQALKHNRNRLCSNYDLHNTLRHLLKLSSKKPAELPPLPTCNGSQSLLHPLPRDRDCAAACIAEHYCTCNAYVKIPSNGRMYQLGKMIVAGINRYMIEHGFDMYCERLFLTDLDACERKFLLQDEQDREASIQGSIETYRIRFHTHPHEGHFESTLRYNKAKNVLDNFQVSDISRLNSYHNDSSCIWDEVAKKFCFCIHSKDKDNVESIQNVPYRKFNTMTTRVKN